MIENNSNCEMKNLIDGIYIEMNHADNKIYTITIKEERINGQLNTANIEIISRDSMPYF